MVERQFAMSYSMMEAYQVKMEQLADDLRATSVTHESPRPHLARMMAWVRKLLGDRILRNPSLRPIIESMSNADAE